MIIKVCGMRDPENIMAVEQLEPDWMGFIFYPKSKRYVSDKEEKSMQAIRQCSPKKVGVFVNAGTDEILEKAGIFELNILQLHGEEPVSQCEVLKEKHFQIVKAFSIETIDDLKLVHVYRDVVDYFLFDTKCEGYGGSGKQFNWLILDKYKENIPFLLSGGISPDSISDLLQFQHPQLLGVDVNSGFEIDPALKDIQKLKTFIKQLKKQ